jgi:hypothetical protein
METFLDLSLASLLALLIGVIAGLLQGGAK